ncbi:alpha-amylase family glycosyl hydrolase [Aestuariibius sp. 2305UL40-4]|uniref:alpha-amylase family glycosyl hydrolase n=1 Tax=Aestuariibius violaceus TaxID=3234132 RepID=UPI00345EE6F4
MAYEPKRRGDWPAAPVIYEIYPRSFRDTTGSGEGDLNGITEGLSHVVDLGVDAIWISPFFVSPHADGGYDVADHRNIDPRYGTLRDFETLVETAHKRGLKVMIDQVLNHTSDKHPWFQRAIDGNSDCADRYVWRDPKPDGTAPNNWLSQFGPPAWTWNHKRRQYYFHQFLAGQPSLDLRNEVVQDKHRTQIQCWRDRGVDGFRFDVCTSYLFDPSMKDNPPASPDVQDKVSGENFVPYTYQDHVYDMLPGDGVDYMKKLRDWAGDDAWLLGEISSGNQSIELACRMTAPDKLDACYTTDLPENKGKPRAIADILSREDKPGAAWWMSSHDQPRHLTIAGDGSDRDARLFAMQCALLPGPWLVFQGEELALPQPDLTREETTDPLDLLYWPDGPGREGARVPIPWHEGADNFGFTSGTPWLPMRWPSGKAVMRQADDGGVAAFYRKLTEARRTHGLGRGTAEVADIADDYIELSLKTPEGNFRAAINHSGEGRAHPDGCGDPVLISHKGDGLPPRSAALYTA